MSPRFCFQGSVRHDCRVGWEWSDRSEAAIGQFAIRACRRTARGAKQQAGGKANARRLQTGRQHIPPRLPDYSARERSAGRACRGCGTLFGNGRTVWTKLLSIGGGYLPVFDARISDQPILPGCLSAFGQTAKGPVGRSFRRKRDLRSVSEKVSALTAQTRSAGSTRGTRVAAKFRAIGGAAERDCEKRRIASGADRNSEASDFARLAARS